MQVIATAGHVDHGKSTLLRALTGMEPDRWAEERRRGMTIDLGYAWMILPSGERMAFVDVPGHERFATNMLAGVGPVPAVLLVIAADSGWSAQTEEHVRALHALRVRHGVVAVTRCDLADPTTAIADARMRLETTTLSTLPVVAVSGTTRTGIDSLVAELDALAGRLPAADGSARVRLWLDRSFVIRGSGTVVTGTLRSGTLRRDDVLEVAGRTVTVRALQCLGEEMPQVTAPARVAVNLRAVAHADVRRGDTLLTPHAWRPGRIVDVRLDSGGTPPARVVVHVGSAAVSASVRALAEDSPVVRLTLLRTLPLEVGDRLLLRDPGARAVLGGATVLDPWPPPLRRRGAARERAAALGGDDGRADLEREVARRLAVRPELLRAIGVAVPDELPAAVVRADGWLVAAAAWRRWLDQLDAVTTQQHSSLLDAGTGTTEVAALLGLPDVHLVDALVRAAPQLETAGGRVRRRGAGPALRADLSAAVGRLEQRLTRTPFVAPERPALSALGLGRRELGAAAAAGAILRLPGDVILMPTAPALAAARLAELPQPFTMSAARQALGTTRRVAVPLLEHLDTLRITERLTPDLRTVRTAPQA